MAGIEIIQSFKINACLVVSVVVLGMLPSSVPAAAAAVNDVVALPPLPQETHDFLEQCASKLTPNCGQEIKAAMYEDRKKNKVLSANCCDQLIAAGWDCHKKFVEVSAPFHNQPEAVANQIWIGCSNRYDYRPSWY